MLQLSLGSPSGGTQTYASLEMSPPQALILVSVSDCWAHIQGMKSSRATGGCQGGQKTPPWASRGSAAPDMGKGGGEEEVEAGIVEVAAEGGERGDERGKGLCARMGSQGSRADLLGRLALCYGLQADRGRRARLPRGLIRAREYSVKCFSHPGDRANQTGGGQGPEVP